MRVVIISYTIFCGWAVESPVGSCGAKSSPDCINDMGSCGNACCAAEFLSSMSPKDIYGSIATFLKTGGSDGLFKNTGGGDGLDISTPEGAWTAIFQGTHTTFKARYIDTLNFNIRQVSNQSSIVRIFSISNTAGALGDEGQNRRTVSMLAKAVGLGPMKVLFGCGAAPSVPASDKTSDQMSTAIRNQQTVEEYFDGLYGSPDFSLDTWLREHAADDSIFQFCPLVATNMPQNPYPHCTNAKGKEAYLHYVNTDNGDFAKPQIAHTTYAVSKDGMQVFSRYMITGTLRGQSVPWFDQVMAWTFDKDGQIKSITFWTDTFYWQQLYIKRLPLAERTSLSTAEQEPTNYNPLPITMFIASGTLMLGIAIGRYWPHTHKSKPSWTPLSLS